MQADIANDPGLDPVVLESPAIKGKLGKRKKSMVPVEKEESKRSSPRIKVQRKKSINKHSDSEDFSAEAKKAGGVLIPILAPQKKQKGGSTGYALFCSEFKTLVKTEYKNSKSNMIEGQKGAPTQKQISKTAANRWSGFSDEEKQKYENMAQQKQVVAIDCSDSESDNKKG